MNEKYYQQIGIVRELLKGTKELIETQ